MQNPNDKMECPTKPKNLVENLSVVSGMKICREGVFTQTVLFVLLCVVLHRATRLELTLSVCCAALRDTEQHKIHCSCTYINTYTLHKFTG
jgi:hypothetical protein